MKRSTQYGSAVIEYKLSWSARRTLSIGGSCGGYIGGRSEGVDPSLWMSGEAPCALDTSPAARV